MGVKTTQYPIFMQKYTETTEYIYDFRPLSE